MTEKLRLGPLPRSEVVRLTVVLPTSVKADLDRYAELYGAGYGEPVDTAALVPHMLATFMERDRAFRRRVQITASVKSGPSSATSDATSSTSDTDADSSPSR